MNKAANKNNFQHLKNDNNLPISGVSWLRLLLILGAVFSILLLLWNYLNYRCITHLNNSQLNATDTLLVLFYGDRCINHIGSPQKLVVDGSKIVLSNGGGSFRLPEFFRVSESGDTIDITLPEGVPGPPGPSGGTGIASVANDVNVTGDISGNILSLGWSGLLSSGRGGVGVNGSSAANGAVLIGNGSGYTLSNLGGDAAIKIINGPGSIDVTCPDCILGGSALLFLAGDSGPTQTLSQNNTILVSGGAGLTSVVSATDKVTLSVGAGAGITTAADEISVNASTSGVTATTSSNSGIEVTPGGIRLLGGCSDTEVLAWSSGTSTWNCSIAGSGTMSSFDVAADGGPTQTITNGNTLSLIGGTGLSTVASATDNITFNIDSTGVIAGSYGSASSVATLTVNAQGQLTTAISTPIAIDATQITSGSLLFLDGDTGPAQALAQGDTINVLGGIGLNSVASATDIVTLNLDDTAVTPGSYGSSSSVATFTVDQQGRLTTASSVAIDFIGNTVTSVTAGAGLTGGGGPGAVTLDVGAGDGIIVAANTVSVDTTTTGTTATTGSNSGLEVTASGVRLLGGCANTEILIWSSGASEWQCGSAGGGGMTSFDVAADGGPTQTITNGNTLSFIGGDGINTVTSATDNVTFDIDLSASGTTVATSSNSGLEIDSSGNLRLLGGCANTEVLVWNSGTSEWECGSSGGGVTFTVAADSGPSQIIGSGDTLTFIGGTGLDTVASATDNITFNLSDTAVTPGSYFGSDNGDGSLDIPTFTVDQQGRLTAAGTSIVTLTGIPNSSLVNSSLTISTTGPLSGGGLVSLGGGLVLSCPTCLTTGGVLFDTVADSGTSTISQGDSVTFVGGAGITTADNGSGTITFTNDGVTSVEGFTGAVTFSATGPIVKTSLGGNVDFSCPTCVTSATALFTLSADSGPSQVITSGNTLSVLGGSGLTSVTSATNNVTLNVGAGDGITTAADSVSVDASTTGTTATTSSNSGLETTASGVRLLGGCANGEVLAWDSVSSVWECATNGGGASGTKMIYKTVNETNSSTTPQDDDELKFNVAASEVWAFQFMLAVNAPAAGDMNFNISTPAGVTSCKYGVGVWRNNTNATANVTCGTASGQINTVGSDEIILVSGTIENGATAGTVNLQWSKNSASGGAATVYRDSYGVAWKYTGADLAEAYNSYELLSPGMIVATDGSIKAGVKKTTRSYQNDAIGVVSTSPGHVLGDAKDIAPGAIQAIIGLSGRVPVMVTGEGGSIKAGDPITSSSTPGYGMKANRSGKIIGRALTDFDSSKQEGLIVVFLENSFSQAAVLADFDSLFKNPAVSLEYDPSYITSTTERNGISAKQYQAFDQQFVDDLMNTLKTQQNQINELKQSSEKLLATLGMAELNGGITINKNTTFVAEAVFAALTTFKGQTVFESPAQFSSNVEFSGAILGNDSTRGSIIVPAGSLSGTKTIILSNHPKVVASPKNKAVLYRVEATASAITVYLEEPQVEDIVFDYIVQQ